MPRYRIAVDTGGTFSDFVYLNEDNGAVAVGKIPSTPDDPSRAILQGVEALIGRFRVLYPRLATEVQVHTKFIPDLRVLAFTLGVSLLTSVLFGMLPALATRNVDLRSSMSSRVAAWMHGTHGRHDQTCG